MSEIIPTQRFVLKQQLDIIKKLYKTFSANGVNIFSNYGFISYETDGGRFTLTPPIVEVIGGQPLLIDGMHRITCAGADGWMFLAAFIEGIPPKFLPYQMGLPHGWADVQMFESKLPDGFNQKPSRYPEDQRKHYFREYPFPGIIKVAREHSKIK
jgi:hypothetical protein